MKYKPVKPITVRTVFENLPRDCESALSEFLTFVHILGNDSYLRLDDSFGEDFVNNLISEHKTWRQFLISNNLITELESELTFSIGDRFEEISQSGRVQMLVAAGPRLINLILVEPTGHHSLGRRYSMESVAVSNLDKITISEFERLAHSRHGEIFRKIETARSDQRRDRPMRHPHPSTFRSPQDLHNSLYDPGLDRHNDDMRGMPTTLSRRPSRSGRVPHGYAY